MVNEKKKGTWTTGSEDVFPVALLVCQRISGKGWFLTCSVCLSPDSVTPWFSLGKTHQIMNASTSHTKQLIDVPGALLISKVRSGFEVANYP